MYRWMWRHLRDPVPLRVAFAVVLAAAVVAALIGLVFPWIDQHLALDIATLG